MTSLTGPFANAVYNTSADRIDARSTDPLHVTLVKLEDGETIQVRGEHTDVADKLSRSVVV